MNKYFGKGLALGIIKDTLQDASTVRIATAFFEPSGFQLLSQVLSGKKVNILIGREYDQHSGMEGVLREFITGLMEGPLEERTEAMGVLRESLASGMFGVKISNSSSGIQLDARFLAHHAKLYIADENECLVCSSNMTWTGLVHAREAGYVVKNGEDVRYFVDKFDEYYNEAQSLTEELLGILDDWLHLHSPYEIYIRSLLNIYGLPDRQKNQRLPELAEYQIPVVSKLLQILKDKKGGILIASTGLGKTVMASHLAAYLMKDGLLDNVLLFCPAGLREMWDRMLAGIRIRYKEYSYHALSADDWKKNRQVRVLEYELHHADQKTLLIIDESHHLRNEDDTRNSLKLRNQRIIDSVNRGCYVLLMTATPYSRGVDDINAQLRVLPVSSSGKSLFGEDRWEVDSPGELSEFPAGVVLTAPTVVRNFSTMDENQERYVLFSGNNRRYFPRKMSIHSVIYENHADKILIHLLKSDLLRVESTKDTDAGALFSIAEERGKRDALQEARFIHQFCSSISEVNSVLDKMSRTDGKSFERVRFARQEQLTDEIKRIRSEGKDLFKSEQDEKLKALIEILNQHKSEKILIFCVYQNTAKYLHSELKKKDYNCETTVDHDPDKLDLILRRFAPVANEVMPEDPGYEETIRSQIDILIATGSLTEGFNLQDASILVNFDLPWTVLVLAQRMGRILRPWKEPRSIHIYNLIPDTMQKEDFYLAIRWKERLSDRNRDLKSFSDLPVLHESSESEDVEMISLARNLNSIRETDLSLDDVLSFIENTDHLHTSSYLRDLSVISADLAEDIKKIPAGFSSYRKFSYKGIYILFRYKNSYYPALIDMHGKILYNSESADRIMTLIRSAPDTAAEGPLDTALRKEYERLLDKSKKIWADERQIDSDQIQIDCCMFLL